MPSVKFLLRGTNPKKEQSIYLQFLYGDKKLMMTSGFHVMPKFWNQDKQEVRNRVEVADREEINEGLSILKRRIKKVYSKLQSEGKYIENNLLRSEMKKMVEQPFTEETSPYVQEYLREFINKAPNRIVRKSNGKTGALKPNTIKQYKTSLACWVNFDKWNGKKTRFEDLTLKFHSDFVQYLQEECFYAASTIATRIKDLKTIAKFAKLDGLNVCEDVFLKEFFKPSDKSKHIYLSENEIEQIRDKDFSHDKRLDNVRDLFIVGLRTGLRISDFNRLKETNIEEGLIYIEEQEKTGDPIIIPLHEDVERILNKLNGKLPRSISNSKFNLYVKEVCREVGLTEMIQGTKNSEPKNVNSSNGNHDKIIYRKKDDLFPKYELVSSHTCRRSFATNLYGVLPNLVIMAITGHKKESTFLNYIKITPKQHAETLREYWRKQMKEKNNGVNMVRLK